MTDRRDDAPEPEWKARAARHWAAAPPSRPNGKVASTRTVGDRARRRMVPAWLAWPMVSALGAGFGAWLAHGAELGPAEPIYGVRWDLVLGGLAPSACVVAAQAARVALRAGGGERWLVVSTIGLAAAGVIGTVVMLILAPVFMGPLPGGDAMVLRAFGILTGLMIGASNGRLQGPMVLTDGRQAVIWLMLSAAGAALGAGLALLLVSDPAHDALDHATAAQAALFGAAIAIGQALATAPLAGRAFPAPAPAPAPPTEPTVAVDPS